MEKTNIPLTKEELIEKYNLDEEGQAYLLKHFEKIENNLFAFLSFHM